ncbi:uncharacterized protein tbrd-2 [Drosophila kikkawai]|uniref:Uncharacterized protein tbrd-2 n=1 Tax=Drosophila kikkawai TaxID=30033 RepID=A0A6P4JC47_DROKI|nr:uncharacterized protein LOC108082286 [Drosophila kikkawai]
MNSSLSVKLSVPTCFHPAVLPKPGMAGVYTNQLHFVKKHLLDELAKKKFATDFMHPVDTEELQIPNYYYVIAQPMDLGTITKRVENNYYRDVEEAIADFRLIIDNCKQFNGVNTPIYRKCSQLERFLERELKNMPKGRPVPCYKDPMATSKVTKANPMAGALEQECQGHLKELQAVTNMTDGPARNFFGPKWNTLSTKVDKQFFKSFDEFCSSVCVIFKKYLDSGQMIYDKAGRFSGFKFTHDTHTLPAASVLLSDIRDMREYVDLMENGVKKCIKHPQKFKSVSETMCPTLQNMRAKLDGMELAITAKDSPNNGEDPGIVEEQVEVPAGVYIPSNSLDYLLDTPDALVSDDCTKLEPIEAEERRNIQTLFCTLPASAMREICSIVHAVENLGQKSGGALSFDLNTFDLTNVYIMKAAVNRALKLHNKVNLRVMQPEEKEGLRCSLESQLTDINERINFSRRKNAAPPTNDKNKNNPKNNGNQKRGRKRVKSPSPQPEARQSAAEVPKKKAKSPPKPNIPPTPVLKQPIQTGYKGHKAGKSKNEGQRMSEPVKNGGKMMSEQPKEEEPKNGGQRMPQAHKNQSQRMPLAHKNQSQMMPETAKYGVQRMPEQQHGGPRMPEAPTYEAQRMPEIPANRKQRMTEPPKYGLPRMPQTPKHRFAQGMPETPKNRGSQRIPATPKTPRCKFPINPGGRIIRKAPELPNFGTPVNPNIIPRTPGRFLPGGRLPVNKTPQILKENGGQFRGHGHGGGGHGKDHPVQPKPTGKPKNVKKIKTLADTSSDEEAVRNVATSGSKKSKQGKKKSQSSLFLTPGNPLNSDLCISSSSSSSSSSSNSSSSSDSSSSDEE